MSYSVALQFAMDTKKVSGFILQEAAERHKNQTRKAFKAYMDDQCAKLNNTVLETLPSISGLPLIEFLGQLRGYEPRVRHGPTPVARLIEDEVAKLAESSFPENAADNGPDHESTAKVSELEKIYAIRMLCRIAVNPDDCELMAEWLTKNAGLLNSAVAASLNTESRDLLQELCVGIAFLARQFRFRIYDKLELVIAALVRALAIALIPWETYVEQFRDAKERHTDLELARGRQILFHHPRMEYQFHEVNHRVLGYIYYTLGDLLFSCPSPKLIHFFECRIFRRKEMTRNVLFTILHVVVINLSEIRAEAEELAQEAKQPSSVSVPAARSMTPLMSRRGKIYSETMWNELPANLYSDIIRVYNDRNRANKVLINEIMALLRSHAPDKLPMFEEATLKALEMYAGAGGGRLPETYPIGRQAAGRDAEGTQLGTGGRRRKSLAAAAAAASDTAVAERTGESVTRLRISRVFDADQTTDRTIENQSIETRSSSSSEGNYSSESTKPEMRIYRRTVIVPKIPDFAPTRQPTHRNRQ